MTAESGLSRWWRWVHEPGYVYLWLARRTGFMATRFYGWAKALGRVNHWATVRGAARNKGIPVAEWIERYEKKQ